MSDLERDLAAVINSHSVENESNTPDWILAQYLMDCLKTFKTATLARESWYDCHHEPGKTVERSRVTCRECHYSGRAKAFGAVISASALYCPKCQSTIVDTAYL